MANTKMSLSQNFKPTCTAIKLHKPDAAPLEFYTYHDETQKKIYQPVEKIKLTFICAWNIFSHCHKKNYPLATECHNTRSVLHNGIKFIWVIYVRGKRYTLKRMGEVKHSSLEPLSGILASLKTSFSLTLYYAHACKTIRVSRRFPFMPNLSNNIHEAGLLTWVNLPQVHYSPDQLLKLHHFIYSSQTYFTSSSIRTIACTTSAVHLRSRSDCHPIDRNTQSYTTTSS